MVSYGKKHGYDQRPRACAMVITMVKSLDNHCGKHGYIIMVIYGQKHGYGHGQKHG